MDQKELHNLDTGYGIILPTFPNALVQTRRYVYRFNTG